MGNDQSTAVSRREAMAASLLAAGGVLAQQQKAKPIRIAHLTDMHVQPERRAGEGYAAALQSLAKLDPPPDFLVTGGDHVMDVMKQPLDRAIVQWDLYQRVLAENTKIPVRPVIGNHDIWGWGRPEDVSVDAPGYGRAMALDRLGIAKPYYAFDAGPSWRAIVLDSMTQRGKGYYGDLGPEQTEWLKGELQSIGTTRPIVIFSHIPILSACVFFDGKDRLGPEAWNVPDAWMHRDVRELLDVFQPCNVKLLVSGHIHLVDRVEYRGMTFVCNGAVCGNWWKGPLQQFPEGYGVINLHADGRFDHRFVTYGWKAIEE